MPSLESYLSSAALLRSDYEDSTSKSFFFINMPALLELFCMLLRIVRYVFGDQKLSFRVQKATLTEKQRCVQSFCGAVCTISLKFNRRQWTKPVSPSQLLCSLEVWHI